MADVWTMGELLVEIMRPEVGTGLMDAGTFRGPYPSGAPAIFIDTVARLGRSSAIIGGVGQDEFGECILKRLMNDGVDCSHVISHQDESTGVAFVAYADDGSRKFIYHLGNTPAVKAKKPASEALQGARYFHIMGCSLMAESTFAREIIQTMHLAKALGAKVSFDPNVRPELFHSKSAQAAIDEVFQNTSIFMPGIDELLLLTGKKTIDEAIQACFGNEALEMIVLKRGSKGCTVHTREQTYRMGVYPVEVVDPTGAGDCFDGAFICGLLDGKTIPEAIELATSAASLNTNAFGPMEGKISIQNVYAQIEENPSEKAVLMA